MLALLPHNEKGKVIKQGTEILIRLGSKKRRDRLTSSMAPKVSRIGIYKKWQYFMDLQRQRFNQTPKT